jgi:hypothetical protein
MIQTESGVRTRVDILTRDPNGKLGCVECKASETAPLSPNQKKGQSELAATGGVIKGKGKPGFPGGMKLPPIDTEIKVKRRDEP